MQNLGIDVEAKIVLLKMNMAISDITDSLSLSLTLKIIGKVVVG